MERCIYRTTYKSTRILKAKDKTLLGVVGSWFRTRSMSLGAFLYNNFARVHCTTYHVYTARTLWLYSSTKVVPTIDMAWFRYD